MVLGALGVFSHMEGVKKSGRGGSGKWSKGRRGDERKRRRRKRG